MDVSACSTASAQSLAIGPGLTDHVTFGFTSGRTSHTSPELEVAGDRSLATVRGTVCVQGNDLAERVLGGHGRSRAGSLAWPEEGPRRHAE